MKIDGCMKPSVLTVKPRDMLAHARQLTEQHRVNQLPVVSDGRLVGILTRSDVLDAILSLDGGSAAAAGFRSRRARPSAGVPRAPGEPNL